MHKKNKIHPVKSYKAGISPEAKLFNRVKKTNLATENKPKEVIDQPIVEEMHASYLDYAMSVIVSRALPDVRDGLKPVHRRILYAMWDIGLKSNAKFRKSATVVGEVLGKYHPHSDTAVYDSLVRMAQDFSMRSPLVWGQGNFGSVDGDAAAAMRYTEAKLTPIAETLIADLEKETVPFIPNYDNSQKEPSVLPAKLPNLLLNGSMGIAVGMATNIPPHNLKELCQAIHYLIDNDEASIKDLMKFIKGPDFPTGGLIFDAKQIEQAYTTGKGGIVVRAKTEIMEEKEGQFQIIISELPYQVNKSVFLEKVASLVKDKKIEGIRDIRDESDKEGLRVVIELKKDTYPQKILNQLFKLTQLQDTFYVNMLALIDGIQPKVLTLKGILEEYLRHRKEMIHKRTEFDLKRAEERAHILNGLKIALDNINEVIQIIKKSADKDEAREKLIKRFKLTEIQTNAILEMRLHQLAHMESKKIEDELKEKLALTKDLKFILNSPKKILEIIKTELNELAEKYGDERRTKVVSGVIEEFKQEDLIVEENCLIALTEDGYIKRLPPDTFKTQDRGGKGVIGLTTKEDDIVDNLLTASTHSNLLLFTTLGKVFQLKAYDVPATTRTAKGQSLVNFLQIKTEEKVSAMIGLEKLAPEQKYFIMTTQKGIIKKVNLTDFAQVRHSGLLAIKLNDDDRLEWVKPSNGEDDIVIVTSLGQSIRFSEKDVRAMGRAAAGVRAIKLKKNDFVVSMGVMRKDNKKAELLVITENGLGKRTSLNQYKRQHRGGSGIKTAKVTAKTGAVVSGILIDNGADDKESNLDLLIISMSGQVIRLPLKSVSLLGRDTQGVRLMRFRKENDKIASLTLI